MKLFIDDERFPPDDGWVIARTSSEAISRLQFYKMSCLNSTIRPEVVSFDHDLGGDDTTRPVVLWIIENEFFPLRATVHSMNTVGREWIEGMIQRYFPEECFYR